MAHDAWSNLTEAAVDRQSGAADIVRRAAEALAALPRNDVEPAVLTLIRSQPSMAPLWRLGSEALSASDHTRAARDFAIRVTAEREEIAKHAAAVLPGPVVTHSLSSTVISAVASSGARAICARSEPGGEGAATVERLTNLGVDARLVEDPEALAAVAEAGSVVVGADAVGPEGVINKLGTRRLADAARRSRTPCYVLAGESKVVDADLPAPHPFERTPLDLFTSVLTQDGPLSPSEATDLARDRPLHPLLQAELQERR